MPKINILSPFVADLIAAGEVVERPASAVKELLENAVDAGARNVTLEIRGGGAAYIRVTDDGCGMSPEDAGVCFLRHATSKLRDERGLEAIGTLGFRGEALAAIASVSQVELTTRERGAPVGTRLRLEAGEIQEMGDCGCPEGTTIVVRGLFYNTPARLKFMKSDKAEGTACVQAALRCALGRPDLSFRCIRDGREEFFTPGDGRPASAVYSLLGRELAAAMLPLASEPGAEIGVAGFVGAPSAGRGSRAAQFFFCNGRPIRSQLLQAAVEQAYRSTLLVGRFPACAVYLTLQAAAVDVNVHPAKTEVKFAEERRVFDAVYYAALGALEAPRAPEGAPAQPAAPRVLRGAAPEAEAPPRAGGMRAPAVPYESLQTRLELPRTPPAGRADPLFAPAGAKKAPSGPPRGPLAAPSRAPAGPLAAPSAALPETPSAADDAPLRVIGEALELYILAQKGETLLVIDKHAAHERILFDRLRRESAESMSQTLLEPLPLSPGAAGAELIEENLALLAELGFGLEPYGEEAYILRAAPYALDPGEARAALEEALEALASSRRPDRAAAREEILKTVACKAAIKAGKSSDPAELQRLAEAVASGEVRYCPHGRPVAWALSRRELDKRFSRIV